MKKLFKNSFLVSAFFSALSASYANKVSLGLQGGALFGPTITRNINTLLGPNVDYTYNTSSNTFVSVNASFPHFIRLVSMAFGSNSLIEFSERLSLSSSAENVRFRNRWLVAAVPAIFIGHGFNINDKHAISVGTSLFNLAGGLFVKYDAMLSSNIKLSFITNYGFFFRDVFSRKEQDISFILNFNYQF